MISKNVQRILLCFFFKEILDWQRSRAFFYWRLKRRLGEDQTIKTILSTTSSSDYQFAFNQLQQWFNEDQQNQVPISQWTNDKNVVQWLEQFNQSASFNNRMEILRKQNARANIRRYVEHFLTLKENLHPSFVDCFNYIPIFSQISSRNRLKINVNNSLALRIVKQSISLTCNLLCIKKNTLKHIYIRAYFFW